MPFVTRSPGPRTSTPTRPSDLRRRHPSGRSRPSRPMARRATKSSRFRPSSAARTRCRWPIPTRPSCSMCRRMNGAWTSTTSRSSTRRARPILGAGFNIKPVFEDHIGSLKAIDPVAQKVVWEYKNKAPLWGGVLTTAGGLVFTGTPEGYLKAFDAKTGEVCGSSTSAPALSRRRSPGNRTASK